MEKKRDEGVGGPVATQGSSSLPPSLPLFLDPSIISSWGRHVMTCAVLVDVVVVVVVVVFVSSSSQWKESAGNQGETDKVAVVNHGCKWEQSFDMVVTVHVDNGTNVLLPKILHMSCRQVGR